MSQNHQNGFQKPSQNGVPKKHRKNDDFQHPHTPLDRALAAARARFSLFDKMCLWHPFGSHFGGVLGAQMEAKAIKKPLQKNIKKMMPKMKPNWSQRDPQMGSSGNPPLLQTARTAWKPTRRSPEGLACRNVAQDMQITPKLPPNASQNDQNSALF